MTVEPPAVRDNWVVPAASRVSFRHPDRAEILARHAAAIESSVPTYVDPTSGFSVFTATFLEARKYCCESGCRHCPYVVE